MDEARQFAAQPQLSVTVVCTPGSKPSKSKKKKRKTKITAFLRHQLTPLQGMILRTTGQKISLEKLYRKVKRSKYKEYLELKK